MYCCNTKLSTRNFLYKYIPPSLLCLEEGDSKPFVEVGGNKICLELPELNQHDRYKIVIGYRKMKKFQVPYLYLWYLSITLHSFTNL